MSDDFERLAATISDRYVIDRELGQGGMATVYLAEDVKHHRKVAVKVLRPELAAVLGTERFLNEIKITANLNHPHILPLLDSGTAEEQPSAGPPVRPSDQSPSARPPDRPSAFLYYVMPCIEGDTLRDRLNRDKQLPVEDALKITEQVASALEYAHRRDVIHRDIKPENILFHEGVALVADFGIALAVKSAGGDRLTETGMSLGTPAYMSPEQVAGDREIDGRSDIYSLACVLYEMLAGDPPFVASNPQAILAKHVTDPAPPITTVRSSVTQTVATAIANALGKARADRFESAKAFAEALYAQVEQEETEVMSIVVLPFENLSPDPDNAFFADGLTEEIITDLSKLRALRVISRNSAMVLKGTAKDTRTIGRELGVQYVLRGSVRRATDRLRITVQLIDAQEDSHLWAERFDGVLDDVFDMQEQVSRSVADTLKLKLTPEETHQLAVRPIQDVQAYQWYLRARQETWLSTPDAVVRAEQYLKKGLEIIGEDALIDAGLAYVYWWYVNIGVEHETYIELAAEYANKALNLDPDSAEAHLVLGLLNQGIYGDQKQSFFHFAKALEIRHDDAHTLFWYALGHVVVGKVTDARPLLERLLAVDPLTPVSMWASVCADVFNGAFRQPGETLTGWLRMEPDNPAALIFAVWFLAYAGEFEELRRIMEQRPAPASAHLYATTSEMFKHAVDGKLRETGALLTEEMTITARRDPMYSHILADLYALGGMREESLDWLENALNRGWINYPFSFQHDPLFEPLREESMFLDLAKRMKKQWEEFGRELEEGGVPGA